MCTCILASSHFVFCSIHSCCLPPHHQRLSTQHSLSTGHLSHFKWQSQGLQKHIFFAVVIELKCFHPRPCIVINFLYSNFLQLCNLFCCQPPEIKLSGKMSSALRLFLPWMSPELMKTRLTSYVSTRSLSLSLYFSNYIHHFPCRTMMCTAWVSYCGRCGQGRVPDLTFHLPSWARS